MANKLIYKQTSKINLYITDSLLMIARSSRHILRNTDQLLGAFFQPIMFLVLFVGVFGGAIEQSLPGGVSYVNFLMAGIIVQTVAFGSTTTAIALTNDLQKGIIDRFRSLPMSNMAVLNGHVVSDIFRNSISTTVMIIAGLTIGFRPNADFVGWLGIIGLLMLITLAFSWLSAIIGVLAKSVEAVQWLTFVIIFPLTFASSAFTPPEDMGTVLRIFAENQPITQMVEAIRALILGVPLENYGWLAVMWCIILIMISIPTTYILYRRKTTE